MSRPRKPKRPQKPALVLWDDFGRRFEEHYLADVDPALAESRWRTWTRCRGSLSRAFQRLSELTATPRAVRTSHAQQWASERLAEGIAASTLKSEVARLQGAFRWGIMVGAHPGPNPFAGLRIPRTITPDVVVVPPDDLRRVLEAPPVEIRLPLNLAAYAGLRRGEIVNLQVGDALPASGQVRVACARVRGAPKGRVGRVIPMPEPLRAAILATPTGDPGDILCRNAGGDKWKELDLSHAVTKYGKSLGVGLGLQTLRKTYATALADRGVPVHRLCSYLGHKSVRTTERYYLSARLDAADVENLDWSGEKT